MANGALLARLRIYSLYPLKKGTPIQKRLFGFDTKLYLIVRLQFWRSNECGVPLHCYYSQVHSELLRSYMFV